MDSVVTWMERHQIALYLLAIGLGVAVGLGAPGATGWAPWITPVLALLLFATFLAVPFTAIRAAWRDGRFLLTLLSLNFVAVPLVVFVLSRVVAHEPALLVGVLLVLLTPCVDYVIAFCRMAGGAADQLVAAAPLLMLGQLLLLPVLLWLFGGSTVLTAVPIGPFIEAFVFVIALPLAAAIAVQWAAPRWPTAQRVERTADATMVPLMMATLFVVIAAHLRPVSDQLTELAVVVPVFVVFLVVMVPVGLLAARVAGISGRPARAVVFSGATRNSLVVLPLALALPSTLALAPLVVVTQTLVELVGMVVLVRLVPRLVRVAEDRAAPRVS